MRKFFGGVAGSIKSALDFLGTAIFIFVFFPKGLTVLFKLLKLKIENSYLRFNIWWEDNVFKRLQDFAHKHYLLEGY